jgi:hypothetical protein
MGKMSVSIYMKGDYEDFHGFGRRENKANSNPIQSQFRLAPRPALGVEKELEKPKPAFGRKSEARSSKPVLSAVEWIRKELKGDLKKQTQFANGQNDVKSILIMSYGDLCGPGRRKNKPNSKPIHSYCVLRDAYCGKEKGFVNDY